MIVVSAGIIYDGSRVLCFLKGESKYPYLSGRYEFPGGKVEPMESPEQALVREFSEELDLRIDTSCLEPFEVIEYPYPDFDVRIHPFLIRYEGQHYRLREHVSAKWVECAGLDTVDWVPADAVIAERLGDILG